MQDASDYRQALFKISDLENQPQCQYYREKLSSQHSFLLPTTSRIADGQAFGDLLFFAIIAEKIENCTDWADPSQCRSAS